jgi:hypothetical protein
MTNAQKANGKAIGMLIGVIGGVITLLTVGVSIGVHQAQIADNTETICKVVELTKENHMNIVEDQKDIIKMQAAVDITKERTEDIKLEQKTQGKDIKKILERLPH